MGRESASQGHAQDVTTVSVMVVCVYGYVYSHEKVHYSGTHMVSPYAMPLVMLATNHSSAASMTSMFSGSL
jgi:hypothetical protein